MQYFFKYIFEDVYFISRRNKIGWIPDTRKLESKTQDIYFFPKSILGKEKMDKKNVQK